MISAVIYDMDGLIVDSEPWWRVAETNVFGRLSVAPKKEEFESMMGWQIREVIQNWYDEHPWNNFSIEKTQNEIIDEVEKLVTENSFLLPGVVESLAFFKNKNIAIALASSSPLKLITNLMTHFGLANNFQFMISAEYEKRGKPHPDVFLTTAKKLNVNPENCLVLEDSYNGVIAAKSAGMKCIAVPCKEHFSQSRFDIADLKISSLTDFSNSHWENLSK